MKVNIVFKNYSFLSAKYFVKFLPFTIQIYKDASIPYFKINTPFFWCPLFFEEYLNPQIRTNKTVDKHSVDYHPIP